jgi:hypothetical protein
MYINFFNKIDNFCKPSKTATIFYKIFGKIYQCQIESYIYQLESLIHQVENTQYYDKCLEKLILLLTLENRNEQIIYYINQSVHYYRRNKDQSNELKSLYKLLDICENTNVDRHIFIANCHKDIAYILEYNFELDDAVNHLLIARSIMNKYSTYNLEIQQLNFKIACIYISRGLYDISHEYLYGILFFKPKYTVYYKENEIIIIYILNLLARGDMISVIRKKLEEITLIYLNFYETDEYDYVINIISSIENNDNEHFIFEIHRFSQIHQSPIFRDLYITIKKRMSI